MFKTNRSNKMTNGSIGGVSIWLKYFHRAVSSHKLKQKERIKSFLNTHLKMFQSLFYYTGNKSRRFFSFLIILETKILHNEYFVQYVFILQ